MDNPVRKKILVIGGTGIIGEQIVHVAIEKQYEVFSISLERGYLPGGVEQIISDRTQSDYRSVVEKLNDRVSEFDLVVDAISFDGQSARSTYESFGKNTKRIIIISTTLVYDRTQKNNTPITEENILAITGQMGGYVDGKLEVERFWQEKTDVAWTIFRPYHILGEHSLLGCLPKHNRDMQLLELLKSEEPLELFDGGNTEFNYIHPKDIASGVFALAENEKTIGKAYNLVNPKIIKAKEYYSEIARQIGVNLKINSIDLDEVWNKYKQWELTTLPHVYSASGLFADTGFIPGISLGQAVSDALKNGYVFDDKSMKVHERMNKMPRPQFIEWLRDYYDSRK